MPETAIEASFEAHKQDHERRWTDHANVHDDLEVKADKRFGRVNARLNEHDTMFEEIHATSQFIRGSVRTLVWMVGFLVGALGLVGTVLAIRATLKG